MGRFGSKDDELNIMDKFRPYKMDCQPASHTKRWVYGSQTGQKQVSDEKLHRRLNNLGIDFLLRNQEETVPSWAVENFLRLWENNWKASPLGVNSIRGDHHHWQSFLRIYQKHIDHKLAETLQHTLADEGEIGAQFADKKIGLDGDTIKGHWGLQDDTINFHSLSSQFWERVDAFCKAVEEFLEESGIDKYKQRPEDLPDRFVLGYRQLRRGFVMGNMNGFIKEKTLFVPVLNLCGMLCSQLKLGFPGLSFENLTLPCAKMRNGGFHQMNFRRCILYEADFTNSSLDEALLDEAFCMFTDFTNIRASQTSWRRAYMNGINFTGATLCFGDFRDARISDCYIKPLSVINPRTPRSSVPIVQELGMWRELLGTWLWSWFSEADDGEDEDNEDEDHGQSDDEEDKPESVHPELGQTCQLLLADVSASVSDEVHTLKQNMNKAFEKYAQHRSKQALAALDKKLSDEAVKLCKDLGKFFEKCSTSATGVRKGQLDGFTSALRGVRSQAGGEIFRELELFKQLFEDSNFESNTGALSQEALNSIEVSLRRADPHGAIVAASAFLRFQLQDRTKYSAGTVARCRQVLTMKPTDMKRDIHELDMIAQRIEQLQQTVSMQSWDDLIEDFLILHALAGRLKGERSHALLVQIFASQQLREHVAFAKLFQKMVPGSTLPQQLLLAMKTATAMIKRQSFEYTKAVRLEQEQINRVLDLQQRLVALLGTACIGVFVGLCNLAQAFVYDYVRS